MQSGQGRKRASGVCVRDTRVRGTLLQQKHDYAEAMEEGERGGTKASTND